MNYEISLKVLEHEGSVCVMVAIATDALGNKVRAWRTAPLPAKTVVTFDVTPANGRPTYDLTAAKAAVYLSSNGNLPAELSGAIIRQLGHIVSSSTFTSR